jgi:hypothetical protein
LIFIAGFIFVTAAAATSDFIFCGGRQRQRRSSARGVSRQRGHLDVPLAVEELAVEVGDLDRVHVRHVHLSLGSGAEAHHRPILQHLAPDRSRAYLRGSSEAECVPRTVRRTHE